MAQGTRSPAIRFDQGRKIFRKCQSCHQVGVSAKHTVGPLLNDIYGRRAGTLEGYRYSRAMEAAGQDGLVWSEEALSAYLEDPKSAVHGTKMNFGGLRDPDDRRAVVAFCASFLRVRRTFPKRRRPHRLKTPTRRSRRIFWRLKATRTTVNICRRNA
ncbi:MAG: cytochrome c family protein [Alphaproteobacteria bacterium]|nr:cytochrome c family protein [Alphaproteobacteria bacterium]